MKLLEKTTTTNGLPVEIWISKTLTFTPVIGLVLRTYAELLDKKLASPTVHLLDFGEKIHKKTKVIWAQSDDGTPLGGIYYRIDKATGMAWIILSFTSPEFRGQGVNALCHHYLEQDCQKRGIQRILSSVHINNQARLNSATKVEMYPLFHTMYKKIKN
jgi:hypothetical protein